MEMLYSHGFPHTHDIQELIGQNIHSFNFFVVSKPRRSIVIHATNERKEIFDFEDFKKEWTYVLGVNQDGFLFEISKRELANEKFKSLPEEDQFGIIREMIIDRMLGKL